MLHDQMSTIRVLNEAILNIRCRYTFYGTLISRWSFVADPTVVNATIGLNGLRLSVRFNPTYVSNLTVECCMALILRLILHVLFRHLSMSARDYPDSNALVIAQNVTANEFITETLPPDSITLSQFPILPAGESTIKRYERLEECLPVPADAGNPQRKPDTPSIAGERMLAMIVEEEIELACSQVTAEDLEELPDGITLPKKEDGGFGTGAGSCSETIAWRPGRMNWRAILELVSGSQRTRESSLRRPSRRLPEYVGIVPGSEWPLTHLKVMTVIDTSGSMSSDDLETINGEMRRIARLFPVIVVECDSEIQRVYPYRPITEVAGRGGTSFVPPLERAFLRRWGPDVVIYFTDGEGETPERPPCIPLIWGLIGEGGKPVKWGWTMRVN